MSFQPYRVGAVHDERTLLQDHEGTVQTYADPTERHKLYEQCKERETMQRQHYRCHTLGRQYTYKQTLDKNKQTDGAWVRVKHGNTKLGLTVLCSSFAALLHNSTSYLTASVNSQVCVNEGRAKGPNSHC